MTPHSTNPNLFNYFRAIEKCVGADNLMEAQWNKFIDFVGDDETNFVVYITSAFSATIYWSVGLLLLSFNFVPYFNRFKIQSDERIDWTKVLKVSWKEKKLDSK